MTAVLPELTGATWDELAAQLAAGGDYDAIIAAAQRKERSERAQQAYRARVDRSGWPEASYAQYLEASAACGGRLVSAAGEQALANEGTGEWPALWNCSERDAGRLASEELRNWWLDHPRITWHAWQRQQREAERIAREAYEYEQETARGPESVPEASGTAGQPVTPARVAGPLWAAVCAVRDPASGTVARYDLGHHASRARAEAACAGLMRGSGHPVTLTWQPARQPGAWKARAGEHVQFGISNGEA